MARNLQELRDDVRTHMDLDTTEMPNGVLDVFAREATHRIEAAQKRWPFRESEWVFVTTPGTSDYSITGVINSEARAITSIATEDGELTVLGRDYADEMWPRSSTGTASKPMAWSHWAGKIRLYPTPSSSVVLYVRGYDRVLDWVAGGPAATPDFPDEFHNTVFLWMLGRAYMQQEDTELAIFYMDMAQDELGRLAQDFIEASPSQPMVLNGKPSRRGVLDRLRYGWER